MFSVKQLIALASKMPGFDLKNIIIGFVDNLSNEIKKQQETNELTDQNNRVVVMTYVNPNNELVFVPVEVTQPTETENSKIVKDFTPINLHQKIIETDIKKAADLLADDDNKLSFFEVLEACKL